MKGSDLIFKDQKRLHFTPTNSIIFIYAYAEEKTTKKTYFFQSSCDNALQSVYLV